MSTSELFTIIMFFLAFNAAWYFALKYLREKSRNAPSMSDGIGKKPSSTARYGH
ncbi:hypothetical protein ACFLXF_03885 [Chloroflexota bacterium]